MNYFETVIRTMDATFSGVLIVKNPTTIVGDTGSNPSLGRFCLSLEQLNPHTATREDKCCTWRKPRAAVKTCCSQTKRTMDAMPTKLASMQLYMSEDLWTLQRLSSDSRLKNSDPE